ncbi:MAG: hypothetical protein GY937_07995 [bacterium]|nr:hypothetical protein [bacterium]
MAERRQEAALGVLHGHVTDHGEVLVRRIDLRLHAVEEAIGQRQYGQIGLATCDPVTGPI